MGLTRNFHGKKGALKFFLRSEGGTPKIFQNKYFLHQAPLQVFVNGPLYTQHKKDVIVYCKRVEQQADITETR